MKLKVGILILLIIFMLVVNYKLHKLFFCYLVEEPTKKKGFSYDFHYFEDKFSNVVDFIFYVIYI
jgi:hypothetical protein